MNTVERIKDVLRSQVKGYRMLLDILRMEREHLINLNAEGVEELLKEKDTIVLKLRLLEEERSRLLKMFGKENNITNVNMQSLCEASGDKDIQSLRLQMISLMQGIAEINRFNRILIDRSMNFFRNATDFLGVLGVNSIKVGYKTIS